MPRLNIATEQNENQLNVTGNVKFVDEAENDRRSQSHLDLKLTGDGERIAENALPEPKALRTMPLRSPALDQTANSVRVSIEKNDSPKGSARQPNGAITPKGIRLMK